MKFSLFFKKTTVLVLAMVILMACSTAQLFPPLPTAIVIPTVTQTPFLSPDVDTATPLPEYKTVKASPVLPATSLPITPDNVSQIQLLSRQGNGIPLNLAISDDGSLLALATTKGVSLYNSATLTDTIDFPMPIPQTAAIFSHDGTFIASAGQDGLVSVYRVEDGQITLRLKSNLYVNMSAMAFSPDDSLLAVADSNRVIHIWNMVDGKENGTIDNNARIIEKLSFAGANNRLYSWSPMEPVKVWNLDTFKETKEISVAPDELGEKAINGSFSGNGAFLAANSGLRIRIFRMDNGYTAQLIRLSEPAVYILLSWDGSQLLVIEEKKAVFYHLGSKDSPMVFPLPVDFSGPQYTVLSLDGLSVYNAKSGLENWKLESASQPTAGNDHFSSDYVLDTAFQDDPVISQTIMMDGVFQTTNAMGKVEKTFALGDQNLVSGAVSGDGHYLATSSKNKGTNLWSADGKLIKNLSSQLCNALAFSASTTLACAVEGGTVTVWKTPEGLVKNVLKVNGSPQAMSISVDGHILAVRTVEGVTTWDLSQADASRLGSYPGYGMVLSGDGKFLAVSVSKMEGQSIIIYSVGSEQPLTSLDAGGHWMAFSEDDRLLAVSGDPLTIWSVNQGILLKKETSGEILGRLAFIHQGKLLAETASDGTLLYWGIP